MQVFNLAEELEKERKKTKDLQGNIDHLVNSNCQLNEYINKLEQDNKKLEELLKSANESITWWTNRYKAVEKNNKKLKVIDKAIKYISSNCILSDEWTDLGFCNFVPTGRITYKQLSKTKVKELLNILKGNDNNGNNK